MLTRPLPEDDFEVWNRRDEVYHDARGEAALDDQWTQLTRDET